MKSTVKCRPSAIRHQSGSGFWDYMYSFTYETDYYIERKINAKFVTNMNRKDCLNVILDTTCSIMCVNGDSVIPDLLESEVLTPCPPSSLQLQFQVLFITLLGLAVQMDINRHKR